MSKCNLILLSGGSGTRLWPLSNGVRAKQFLKVLKSPDGHRESMVQRVIRQISESGLDVSITIATGAAQSDSVLSQVGEAANIVSEPERRDTFPAIALSALYLLLEKKVSRDDVIVVMPIDPYTEIGYFRVISEMIDAVSADSAELVLMGIKPTSASSKFGYILPESRNGKVMKVSRFVEKPERSTAEKLIKDGAFWNGGVFAFRLGYIADIARKYVSAESFDGVLAHYCDFPKISFDYEVAEKAKSIGVLPYDGKWIDLGTWDSLMSELPDVSIGNVITDKNSDGTKIINELPMPVICLGVKDSIVVASPDGILVGTKDASVNIKPYAEAIVSRPMCEERRWGEYRVLDHEIYSDGVKSLIKLLIFKDGGFISYQTHNMREEIWNVVDGSGTVVVDGEFTDISRGDIIRIKSGQKHSVKSSKGLRIIEVQLGKELIESDIKRFDSVW